MVSQRNSGKHGVGVTMQQPALISFMLGAADHRGSGISASQSHRNSSLKEGSLGCSLRATKEASVFWAMTHSSDRNITW